MYKWGGRNFVFFLLLILKINKKMIVFRKSKLFADSDVNNEKK
jgi:hypothetical protein